MSCYRPLRAFRTPTGVVFEELSRHDILGQIELPCGQCIGCRERRASDWSLRVMHEASLHAENCVVGLTYATGSLPPYGSLSHRDFQLFMKRTRRVLKRPVRFFMCGEYGPLNLRPHYHACLFGVDFRSDRVVGGKSGSGEVFYRSATLDKLWGLGICSVQDLVPQTAMYVARYVTKKLYGDAAKEAYARIDHDGVAVDVKPEYGACSLKPGIGANWFAKYGRDVYPHDFVVADGVKRRPPKYYDKLMRRGGAVKMDEIEFARQQRALAAHADNTDERRLVREAVHIARVRNLKREL